MKTKIEIIRVDEDNYKCEIIGLQENKVVINNKTLNTIQKWDLEDLKQCAIFI